MFCLFLKLNKIVRYDCINLDVAGHRFDKTLDPLFPDALEVAKVTLLLKIEENGNIRTYRHISVHSCFFQNA